MNLKNTQNLVAFFIIIAVVFSATLIFAETSPQKYKDDIYRTYGIRVYDYADIGARAWPDSYYEAMIEVFRDLPADFTSCTRMVYMDPSVEQFEVKYDGYNEEYGIVQIGYAYKRPSPAYINRFIKEYGKSPVNPDDYILNFKSMLVRGMTYCFIQKNTDAWGRSDLMSRYQSAYLASTTFTTSLYIPAEESYMVVAPGMSHLWIDLAFAVARYCTDASGLKKNYPERYNFVKDEVFGGAGAT